MITALFVLVVLALVGYGLERNHARQSAPHSRLAGSTDIQDRDLERVDADLRAAAAHEPVRTPRHRRTPTLHVRRSVNA
jgi:hypothetical protein